MNALDLNSIGIKELNAKELQETDGGFLLSLAVGYSILVIGLTMENPKGVLDGFLDCFN